MKFGKQEIAKKNLNAIKTPIKVWDVHGDDIDISKVVKTKTNSKYLNGYLGKDISPLVW